MKNGEQVGLHISRTSICGEEDVVKLQIVCHDTGELIGVVMSLVDYARAITGDINVPAKVVRYKEPE
jgi:hypothetical protein